jgi:hypothetical protein
MYSDSVTQWDDPVPPGTSLFMGIYSNWKLRISNLDCRRMVSNYTWCRSYETLLHRCVHLDDPVREIGRLKEPLLSNEKMKDMYPMVYSCGAIIHNNSLILPYAVSDYSSTYGGGYARIVMH